MASEENVSDVKRKFWSAAGRGRVWRGWEVIGIEVTGQDVTKMFLPLTQDTIVL